MARAVSVGIERKGKLAAKLRRLVPAVDDAIDAAAEKSAREIVAHARSFAPVRSSGGLKRRSGGKDTSPGNLRDAIYAQKVPGTVSPVWKVAVDVGDGPTGKNAFYGFFVEMGAVGQPRQPFFFPAYRLVKKRHRGRVTRAINKEIKKLAVRA